MGTGLKLSTKGVRFISQWEGFRPRLYEDSEGHCTIGYGHLVHLGRCNGSEPARFKAGLTQAQALELLKDDAHAAAQAVGSDVKVGLEQHQFDALVSFSFNVGAGAFGDSTLLRLLNKGKYEAVPSELMRWTDGGVKGLIRRRRSEGALFTRGKYA
jgi:GH24 family phage-related lysozyme (muramidase)